MVKVTVNGEIIDKMQCQYTTLLIDRKVGIPEIRNGRPAYRGCFRDWNCVLAHLRKLSFEGKLTGKKRAEIVQRITQITGCPVKEAPTQEFLQKNGLDAFNAAYEPIVTGAITLEEEKAEKSNVPKKHQVRTFLVLAEDWGTKPKKFTPTDLCYHRKWDIGTPLQMNFFSNDGECVSGMNITDPHTGAIVSCLFSNVKPDIE